MSKTSLLALALAGAALSPLSLAAAPAATQPDADRLKAAIERYIGRPGPGEPAALTIVPEATAYRATFDLKQMLRGIEPLGITLDPASQSLTLSPNDNGTWHVAGGAMPPLVIHMKDQTIRLGSAGGTFEGTFDPRLGVFVDQTMTQDGATLDQEAPGLTQHRRSARSVMTQKAGAAEGMRSTADIRYTLTDTTARIEMRPPPPKASVEVAPSPAPADVTYTVPATSLDVHLDRLNAPALLDLEAFFVAHPSEEAVKAGQEELRTLLKAALPFVSGFTESAALQNVTLQSSAGEFKAGAAGVSLDMADLSGAGTLASVLTLESLALPSGLLPPWAAGFLPSRVDLRPTLTGVHVDAAVKEAVEAFDLQHDGLTPEQKRHIGQTFWPGDGKVSLAPSRIVSPLLDIRVEGEATVGEQPAGRLTLTAAGLDKAIETLQGVADTDPVAGQVLAQFVAAKNLGKPNPDGTFVWVVEAAANGPLSVNGIPLK